MDDAKGEFPRSPSITPTRPGRGGVGVRAKRRIGGKAPTNGTGSRASGLRGYLLRFEGPSCRAPTDPRHRASPPSSAFLPRLLPSLPPRGSRAGVRARVSSVFGFGSFSYLSLSLPLGVDHAPQAVVKHVDSHHDCSCPLALAPLLSVVVLCPPPGFRLDPPS